MENQKQTKKKKRKPIIIAICLGIVLIGVGGFYWIRSTHYESTDDAQIDGNIYAVRSSVTAYLDSIYFKDHQHVQKGDTLLVFDTKSLEANVAKAKAALEKAKTNLNISDLQAVVSKNNAQASHQTTLSGQEHIAFMKAKYLQAKEDVQRDKKLLKINAVTQKQYEADQTALHQAKAAYERAKHQQKSSINTSQGLSAKAKAAQHKTTTMLAVIAQRKAQLALAKENLSHAYVLAPCTGIVTKRTVNTGQYVLSGQSLCSVVDENDVWVTANFKETTLHKIHPGQSVKISVDAFPDLDLKGIVASNGGATGAQFALIKPNNATGNFIKVTQRYPLRIQLTNLTEKIHKSIDLLPGLSVEVSVKTK